MFASLEDDDPVVLTDGTEQLPVTGVDGVDPPSTCIEQRFREATGCGTRIHCDVPVQSKTELQQGYAQLPLALERFVVVDGQRGFIGYTRPRIRDGVSVDQNSPLDDELLWLGDVRSQLLQSCKQTDELPLVSHGCPSFARDGLGGAREGGAREWEEQEEVPGAQKTGLKTSGQGRTR